MRKLQITKKLLTTGLKQLIKWRRVPWKRRKRFCTEAGVRERRASHTPVQGSKRFAGRENLSWDPPVHSRLHHLFYSVKHGRFLFVCLLFKGSVGKLSVTGLVFNHLSLLFSIEVVHNFLYSLQASYPPKLLLIYLMVRREALAINSLNFCLYVHTSKLHPQSVPLP